MHEIDDDLHELLLTRHGVVDPAWLQRIAIPGDDAFPALRLPEDRLRYSIERGYPLDVAACRHAGVPLLVVQITSFELARGPGGWAIPMAYTPKTDDQRIRKALGFDEGWEDAEPECMFVCDRATLAFWVDAAARGRLGLTVVGGTTLYPAHLGDRERARIEPFAAACAAS